MIDRLLRGRQVDVAMGNSRSGRYVLLNDGRLTRPIKRSPVDSVWPESEILALGELLYEIRSQPVEQVVAFERRVHQAIEPFTPGEGDEPSRFDACEELGDRLGRAGSPDREGPQ